VTARFDCTADTPDRVAISALWNGGDRKESRELGIIAFAVVPRSVPITAAQAVVVMDDAVSEVL
jgi:hypothetical protein